MGPLICCLDESEVAGQVLALSRTLAERLGLDLELLYVAPSVEAPGVSAAPLGQERLRRDEEEHGDSFLVRIAREAGLEADVPRRVEIGDAAGRIVAVCEAEGAELVVLGSRGRGTLKSALLGSVSSQVAGSAPCPCLIVPPGAVRGFLA